jgi:lipid II:glycine glycyltransferase (peptidoglycan interpeptide bridge formation enzyme)
MKWKGFKDFQATILIDLNQSLEELWNKLDKDARWGVKRAEKENLTIKNEVDNEDIYRFYKIYLETCKNGGINPQELDNIKKNASKFFICYKDEKVIAGTAIIIENNEKYRLYINGSSQEYLKFQPNNLLYWDMIRWGKENNYKLFDLGGYQLNTKHGDKLYHVNRFKERWGGEIKTYSIYSYNPIKIIGRKVIRNSKVARKIWNQIKKINLNKNN